MINGRQEDLTALVKQEIKRVRMIRVPRCCRSSLVLFAVVVLPQKEWWFCLLALLSWVVGVGNGVLLDWWLVLEHETVEHQ